MSHRGRKKRHHNELSKIKEEEKKSTTIPEKNGHAPGKNVVNMGGAILKIDVSDGDDLNDIQPMVIEKGEEKEAKMPPNSGNFGYHFDDDDDDFYVNTNNAAVDRSKDSMPRQIYHQKQMIYRTENGDEKWPSSVDTWCWWCKHPFDGPPIPLPTGCDFKRKRFRIRGCFCSWNCMKAYNNESSSFNSQQQVTFITFMHQCIYGTIKNIPRAAPDWRILRVFGGSLSIEEFRDAFESGDTFKMYYDTQDRNLTLHKIININGAKTVVECKDGKCCKECKDEFFVTGSHFIQEHVQVSKITKYTMNKDGRITINRNRDNHDVFL